MSTRSSPPSTAFTTTRRCEADCASPAGRPPRRMRRNASTRSGRTCSKASFAVLERAARYGRAAARWLRLLLTPRPRPGLRVFYGHDRVPRPGRPVAGGTAKFQRLVERFPNSPTDFSLLYLGSTWLPRDLRPLLSFAHRRRVPVV